jgi:hypothetical protein
MKSSWGIVCGLMLILATGAPTRAATAPFAITGTNVTLSMSGMGSSEFTVTGIPTTGSIYMQCTFTGATTMVLKAPICPMTPSAAYPVTAGGTLQGSITFYPPNGPVPASVPVAGAALAGVLLLGLRRKGRNWVVLVVLCVACLAGISACGGSSNGMTPGTYPYRISASTTNPLTNIAGQVVTTTINVTVP